MSTHCATCRHSRGNHIDDEGCVDCACGEYIEGDDAAIIATLTRERDDAVTRERVASASMKHWCGEVDRLRAECSALRARAERAERERDEVKADAATHLDTLTLADSRADVAEARVALRDMEIRRVRDERDATKRSLHRWQCGEQIEGDYVCDASLTVQRTLDEEREEHHRITLDWCAEVDRVEAMVEHALTEGLAECTRLRAEVAAMREAITRAARACSQCNGKGTYESACRFCGDSTYDHECVTEMRDCRRCAPIRSALSSRADEAAKDGKGEGTPKRTLPLAVVDPCVCGHSKAQHTGARCGPRCAGGCDVSSIDGVPYEPCCDVADCGCDTFMPSPIGGDR